MREIPPISARDWREWKSLLDLNSEKNNQAITLFEKWRPALNIDLKSMSHGELKKLAKRVERALKSHEKRNKKAALQAMEKVAKEHGFSMKDIIEGGNLPKKRGPKPGSKRKAKPKFRNPANKDQTWSGRGRRPEWYKDALASGKTDKDMAI